MARIGLVSAALLLTVVGVGISATGDGADSVVVLVDRDYALASPLLRDCPAYDVSADKVMIVAPRTVAGSMPTLQARGPLAFTRVPMWVTPDSVAEETARAAGIEILFREGPNTVFRASEDAAYGLLARGFFIVKIDWVPLRRTEPAARGRLMVGGMLEARPLDSRRKRFLRSVADSVDTLRLKSTLRYLQYDDVNHRYRSRFQARPEVRQEVVPHLRDALESSLVPYGGYVTEQQFVQKLGGSFACTGAFPCDTIFVNVIGTKPGKKTSAHYVICAHYDAIAIRTPGWSDQWYMEGVAAPGCDDNGTGVASVLECARLLAPLDLDVGVKFITFSGEEPGLLGSDYYVDHLAAEDSVIAVINFDMVGYVDQVPLIEIVYDWRSQWLADQLEDVAHALDLDSPVELVNLSGVADSDHASFWKKGIPGNMLIEELYTIGGRKGGPKNPYYHTLADTLGHLTMGLAGDAVGMVAGLIARFAELPEDSMSDLALTEGSVELDWDGRDLTMPLVAGDSLEATIRAINLGKAMDEPEPYTLEVWSGRPGTGSLVHTSSPILQVLKGESTDLECTWRTSPTKYGDLTYTFALLPDRQDLESNIANNSVEVAIEIMPQVAMLTNVHVTPHPVSYTEGEPRLRFEILHPEGDFNAVMEVLIYDVLGTMVGRGYFESTPVRHDFEAGENSIEFSRLVSRPLAPGLYVCKVSIRLLGEPGLFEQAFEFAVGG
jgi:hypothetical protein